MDKCRCDSKHHANHKGQHCEAAATEPDGYCKTCHDLAGEEWKESRPEGLPDLPPGMRR